MERSLIPPSPAIPRGVFVEFNSTGIEIINSTISNNQYHGFDPSGAGVYIAGYSATITGTTISGNTAGQYGGGIFSYHSVTITNSTISGNTAENNGGGIYFYAGNTEKLKLNGVTMSGNSAISGGGIYVNSGTIEPANTILYGNSGTVSGADCYDTANHVTSQGNNILGDNNSCPNFTGSGDQVGVNPLLIALANNGGLTQTHALQGGSPAINAGNPATCIGYDQRYYPRNGICDIGAYEIDAPVETVTPTQASTLTPTPTNTIDPHVTPTVTSTATPAQGDSTELLINGGFEAITGARGSDLLPWKLNHGTKDKIKCNTLTKEVAYEGECAFQFKGGAGENSKLSQSANSVVNFSISDALSLSMYVNAKGAVNMKAKAKVKYADDTPADKINLTMTSTSGYELLQNQTFMAGDTVSKIKVQIQNLSTSGKIYIDAVSLLHSPAVFRSSSKTLPLP